MVDIPSIREPITSIAPPVLVWWTDSPDAWDSSVRCAPLLDRLFSHPPPPGTLTRLGRLLAYAGGRRVWSKKLAPP
jgi:hypothetical protein